MQKLNAILKLIRWPNLLFIALTQLLVYYCIIYPSGQLELVGGGMHLSKTDVFLLMLSTALIAASGYMINDYFDIRIDQVNKPKQVVLDKVISRRGIIIWHTLINLLALFIILETAFEAKLRFVLIQMVCIIALLIYSISFKRRLFIGNLLIGFLTSMSLLTMGIYETEFQVLGLHTPYQKMFWLYTGFAFIITIAREIIKDVEDIKGDLKEECRTIPIVFGINWSRQLVYILFFFLFGIITAFVIKMHAIKTGMCVYYILGIVSPSVFILYKLKLANSTEDFGQISRFIKWLTLSGILSMLLIPF